MKIIKGLKIGGIQQKIFNLVLIFILALVGANVAVAVWQQWNLSEIVRESNALQQDSIEEVSQETMESMLSASMAKSTALQAYIADDLFGEVRTDVLTLQAFASAFFANADSITPGPASSPSRGRDGTASVQFLHEAGVNPADSESLGIVSNMSDIMLSMFKASSKLSGCFVGTADGNLVFVNDRPGAYRGPDGKLLPLDVRSRPWYTQAAAAGELIFTAVELDTYTEIPMLECAAPVYRDGELVAVVGADISLSAVSDYVRQSANRGGFLCVVNEHGQVLFSPAREGAFLAAQGGPDLRKNENKALARFVDRALHENTDLAQISVEGKTYYLTGAPMESVGWAVLSVVDRDATRLPADTLLNRFDEIHTEALETYRTGASQSTQTIIALTTVIFLLAVVSALKLAARTVRPLEIMTRRIDALRSGDVAFEMEDVYRTDDEIEILAESVASLSRRTRAYIDQITQITAEKERIGTELALATRIQADMLPNIFPAFPDRSEFDIYATMSPAKEVGGDFYDFFLIDDNHLAMVMADVSGKGVPAALFMMVSKILVQNYAMTGRSPAQVLQAVNHQICSNNREEMFVTVWFGILDTRTGKIVAANAGHEYPALMDAGGTFSLVRDRHGFVIGGMDGIRYREYELELRPGAKLFLYTDGVPEATDANQELFGTERMLSALNEDTSAPPEEVLRRVRAAVDGFVKDAEQFDDLTMLCLAYKGGSGETAGPNQGIPGQ